MRRLLFTLALMSVFAVPAPKPAHAEEFTRGQIEDIVREFIQKNPEVMIQSVEAYGRKQQEEEQAMANEAAVKNMDWMTKNKHHAEAGNKKGDVTIVEFFDYNCGYCKQAVPDVMELLDDDKKLRLVFIEIPILGPSSMTAAKWALAAKEQNSYLEYHLLLMKHKGPMDEAILADYASKLKLDVDKMRIDANSPETDKILQENLQMSQKMGIQGTPAFIVGKEVIRGYVSKDVLAQAAKKAREEK